MGKQRFPVDQVIKNLDGSDGVSTTRSSQRCEACGQFLVESEPFTVRKALVQCLVNEEISPQGQPIRAPGPKRYQRTRLALRIDDAKETIRLSEEEIIDIRELAAKFLAPVAQMRVWDMLDPPEEEDEEDDDDSV